MVIDPLRTEVGAAHDWFAPAKLVGELGLETSKDRLGIGRAAFGGHRNRVTSTEEASAAVPVPAGIRERDGGDAAAWPCASGASDRS